MMMYILKRFHNNIFAVLETKFAQVASHHMSYGVRIYQGAMATSKEFGDQIIRGQGEKILVGSSQTN